MTINRFAELARVFAPYYARTGVLVVQFLCSTSQSHFIKLTMCLFSARSVHWTDERDDVRATIFDLLWTAHVAMR